MNENQQKQLGTTLWGIANKLRGAMNADDFRDYMLSFLFLRYLSDNYEEAVKKELGRDYAISEKESRKYEDKSLLEYINAENLEEKAKKLFGNEYEAECNTKKATPLMIWYVNNVFDVEMFESQMRRKAHYIIKPYYLWSSIYELAKTQSNDLLKTLQAGFKHIENESFDSKFHGLFSEVNLDSDKLGKNYPARNTMLCSVITEIAKGLSEFPNESDLLGDAYEYLIGQFAAGSGKKAGEFYTPQQVSTILSRIVTLDSQDPSLGKKPRLKNVLDFACGSGSLLINVKKQLGSNSIGQIYGQEKILPLITLHV